jgi:hypothetical protein
VKIHLPLAVSHLLGMAQDVVRQGKQERERVIGHGLVVRAESHGDSHTVPRCGWHIDLIVSHTETGDDAQLGGVGKHALRVRLDGCQRTDNPRQQCHKLVFR